MSDHHKKGHHHGADPVAFKGNEGSSIGPQFEPDNYLLEYQAIAGSNTWIAFATVAVDPVIERWTVDTSALLGLGSAAAVRISGGLATLPTLPNALDETADTVVVWAPTTDPSFPTVGSTFEGAYNYAGVTMQLAINFQTAAVKGGAAIALDTWFNPDLAGRAVNLKTPAQQLVLSAVKGKYAGRCVSVAVPKRYAVP